MAGPDPAEKSGTTSTMATDFAGAQGQPPGPDMDGGGDDGAKVISRVDFAFFAPVCFDFDIQALICAFAQLIRHCSLFLDLAQRCLHDWGGLPEGATDDGDPPPRRLPWILNAHAALSCWPVLQHDHVPVSYKSRACTPVRGGVANCHWM